MVATSNPYGRQTGVLKPVEQERALTDAPELSIISLCDVKFLSVVYVEKGRQVMGLIADINGELAMAPAAETWMKGLRSLTPKFEENVRARLGRISGTVPEDIPKDAVDVIATNMAAGASEG